MSTFGSDPAAERIDALVGGHDKLLADHINSLNRSNFKIARQDARTLAVADVIDFSE